MVLNEEDLLSGDEYKFVKRSRTSKATVDSRRMVDRFSVTNPSSLMQVSTNSPNASVVHQQWLAIREVNVIFNGTSNSSKTITYPGASDTPSHGRQLALPDVTAPPNSRSAVRPQIEFEKSAAEKSEPRAQLPPADFHTPAVSATGPLHSQPQFAVDGTEARDLSGQTSEPSNSEATPPPGRQVSGDPTALPAREGPLVDNKEAASQMALEQQTNKDQTTPPSDSKDKDIGDRKCVSDNKEATSQTPLQQQVNNDETGPPSHSKDQDDSEGKLSTDQTAQSGTPNTQTLTGGASQQEHIRPTKRRSWAWVFGCVVSITVALAISLHQAQDAVPYASLPSSVATVPTCAISWPATFQSCTVGHACHPPAWLTQIEDLATDTLRLLSDHQSVLEAAALDKVQTLPPADADKLKSFMRAMSAHAATLSTSSRALATLSTNTQTRILTVLCEAYAVAYAQEKCNAPATLSLLQTVQEISLPLYAYQNCSVSATMLGQAFALQSAERVAAETWDRVHMRTDLDKVGKCLWYALGVDLEVDCTRDDVGETGSPAHHHRPHLAGPTLVALLAHGVENIEAVQHALVVMLERITHVEGKSIAVSAGAERMARFPWVGFGTVTTGAEWVPATEWVRRLAREVVT